MYFLLKNIVFICLLFMWNAVRLKFFKLASPVPELTENKTKSNASDQLLSEIKLYSDCLFPDTHCLQINHEAMF